jgi:thiamine transport system substrate-binding protein
MKRLVCFVLFICLPSIGAQVTVYTYDSFAGKGTLGELMAARSEAATGCTTRYVTFSTAGEALNQLAVDGKKVRADVLVGVDQTLLKRAREVANFEPLGTPSFHGVDTTLAFDETQRFLPFDYGYLAVVYDDRRKNPPSAGTTFADFSQNPLYHKRMVLEDPRTSSLGRSLLVWSQLLFPGKRNAIFWKDMRSQTLTVSPGWSAAYGLFLNGEVDFTVSYTTSPAYHIEKEGNSHIRAVIFPEGNYRQVETVAVHARAPQKECAKKWADLLLSAEIQKELPLLQWMYPAREKIALPRSFTKLPSVAKVLDGGSQALNLDRKALKDWAAVFSGAK